MRYSGFPKREKRQLGIRTDSAQTAPAIEVKTAGVSTFNVDPRGLLTLTHTTRNRAILISHDETSTLNSIEFVRVSDGHLGTRFLKTGALQLLTNLIVGGSSTLADDGNPRFLFYSGTSQKVLIEATGMMVSSDARIRWDNATGVAGNYDLILGRASANTLYVQGDSTTGVGPTLELRGKDSTTSGMAMADFVCTWTDSTHASYKTAMSITMKDASGTRTCISCGADGTNPTLSFYGATKTAQQTVTGSRGGNAALTDLLTKLATVGLIVDGSSA